MKTLITLCFFGLTPTAHAQEFTVLLGKKNLGSLTFSQSGTTARLHSTLNQTPMGVFNGTFKGTSAGNAKTATFTGDSKSSRKQRHVVVDHKNARPVSVDISPQKERTELSDPSRVTGPTLDPVRAIAHLISARGCPAAVRLYDGRRVIAITPTQQTQAADHLTCAMRYKVTQGPGHLSPLRISSAKMQLRYATSGTKQILQQIKISSGVFGLSLNRKK
ncbi:hypothetical protein [Parasphingorhabdus sp.]|uniref:hypothetical protein n=1 Tax=Parasphingorhabdus sp. TaxID=2709688 RepID=UPI003296A512